VIISITGAVGQTSTGKSTTETTSKKLGVADESKILGVWLNEEKDCRIKVYKEGEKYFGKIIWLDGMDEPGWKPVLDDQNPDPEKRKLPLLGMKLVSNFIFDQKAKEWRNGKIYDARSGKLYNCFMRLNPDNSLKITGYIGAQWMGLGESTRWTRFQ
jgi:uncharacterized protein (DUF2147 family)